MGRDGGGTSRSLVRFLGGTRGRSQAGSRVGVPSSRGAAAFTVLEDRARTPGTRPVPAQHAQMLSAVEDMVRRASRSAWPGRLHEAPATSFRTRQGLTNHTRETILDLGFRFSLVKASRHSFSFRRHSSPSAGGAVWMAPPVSADEPEASTCGDAFNNAWACYCTSRQSHHDRLFSPSGGVSCFPSNLSSRTRHPNRA